MRTPEEIRIRNILIDGIIRKAQLIATYGDSSFDMISTAVLRELEYQMEDLVTAVARDEEDEA